MPKAPALVFSFAARFARPLSRVSSIGLTPPRSLRSILGPRFQRLGLAFNWGPLASLDSLEWGPLASLAPFASRRAAT